MRARVEDLATWYLAWEKLGRRVPGLIDDLGRDVTMPIKGEALVPKPLRGRGRPPRRTPAAHAGYAARVLQEFNDARGKRRVVSAANLTWLALRLHAFASNLGLGDRAAQVLVDAVLHDAHRRAESRGSIDRASKAAKAIYRGQGYLISKTLDSIRFRS